MFLLLAVSILSTITAKNKKNPLKPLADTKRKQIKANLIEQLTEEFEGSNF